jgi:murein DD-endopeptidase MepM/ murein hydrolase activator NlpD
MALNARQLAAARLTRQGVPSNQIALAQQYGRQYGIDPRLLLAIGGHETRWGTLGAGRQGYTLGYGATDTGLLNQYAGVGNQYRNAARTLSGWGARSIGDVLAGKASRYATDPAWERGVASTYRSLGGDLSGGIPATAAPAIGPTQSVVRRPPVAQGPVAQGSRFSLIPLVARSLMQGRKIDFGQIAQALRQQATIRQQPIQQPARQQPLTSGPKGAGVPARASPVEGGWADPARGKVIGTPFVGTHADIPNWESQRALDISLPFGSPVYSPFAGTIGSQFGSLGAAPSSRFGGLRLHVAAPTGQEWYGAHLSRFAPGIRPGRRVRPGQVIGYSGSAAGVPHLHEALRYGDPYRLIR